MDTTTIVDRLNSFLREELTAVESYRQALEGRSAFSGKTELSQCQGSHEERAKVLRERIEALGGKPADTTGLVGAAVKVAEGAAVAMGGNAAISLLEIGEDRILRDYRKRIPAFEDDVRVFLESKVLAQQEYTHHTLSEIKRRLAWP